MVSKSFSLRRVPVLGPALQVGKHVSFHAAMSLPLSVQRAMSGPAIEGDGQTLAPDTQIMLMLKKIAGEPVVERLPIPLGRRVLAEQMELAGGIQPIGSVEDHWVNGHKARLFVPTQEASQGALLVFFHGGGFMYGSVASYDAACRFLAEQSGVRLLSVDYRLAPEHPFPAAYDDAHTAFEYVRAHAGEFGANPKKIGVGGDSAGGNLAAGVALTAGRGCVVQLLIYPAVDFDERRPSRELFAEGFYLTDEFTALAEAAYAPASSVDTRDPRLSPMYAAVRKTTAPALIVTAGFDPLRDEGEAYAAKLAEAGIEVQVRRFEDQIHGFFNVVGAGHTARAAVIEIAAELRARFA